MGAESGGVEITEGDPGVSSCPLLEKLKLVCISAESRLPHHQEGSGHVQLGIIKLIDMESDKYLCAFSLLKFHGEFSWPGSSDDGQGGGPPSYSSLPCFVPSEHWPCLPRNVH